MSSPETGADVSPSFSLFPVDGDILYDLVRVGIALQFYFVAVCSRGCDSYGSQVQDPLPYALCQFGVHYVLDKYFFHGCKKDAL